MPWEDRPRLGLGPAIVGTAELFVRRPREGFARARRQGELMDPLLWLALVSFVGAVLQVGWGLLVGLPLERIVRGSQGDVAWLAVGAAGGAIQVVMRPIIAVAMAFVVAAIFHGCLALFGALELSRLGFEGSLRAVAYASTAQLALVVPVAGGLIALLWNLVLVAIGLEIVHDTTFGRALAAVLVPFLACCLCGLLAGVGLGAAIAGLVAS